MSCVGGDSQLARMLSQEGGAMSNRLHSIAETAQAWGVSKDTVRRLLGSAKVRSVRIGRRVMIPADEIQRVCTEGTAGGSRWHLPPTDSRDSASGAGGLR